MHRSLELSEHSDSQKEMQVSKAEIGGWQKSSMQDSKNHPQNAQTCLHYTLDIYHEANSQPPIFTNPLHSVRFLHVHTYDRHDIQKMKKTSK